MRKFFLLMMALGVSLSMMASDKLSARTQSFLQQRASTVTQQFNGKSTLAKTKTANGVEYIDCFISLNDASTSALEAKGVIIDGSYTGFVTAKVPVGKIEEVASLSSVKQVGIARNLRLFTDKAKTLTNADKAWDGTNNGLPLNYTGKDVVVGIIDDGIEFNHPAFKDADSNTRVKAVYLPNATSANGGSRATVDGVQLSGYQYTTASQIAALTTDDTGETHGTHTSGCAGATTINGYSGMAPECDLVLCGCGENLTETAILNSAKYIANYAQSVGKPCVISISLGSEVGPHDGYSSISMGYAEIAEQYGAVILLAAGNEADVTGHATKTLSSSSDAMAVIHTYTDYFSSYGYTSYYGLVGQCDIWNSTSDQLKVKVLVVNSSGTVQYESSAMSNGTISASTLSSYFSTSNSSGISISGGVDANNNRYNLYISTQLGKNQGSYKVVYVVTGSAGNVINAWTESQYSQFGTSGSISGYTRTNGIYEGTMCDDMCSPKVIGVGAYCSRTTFPYNHGSSTANVSDYYGTTTLNDIASFSSYGVDCNGTQQPFITAPGHTVVSSINRHNSSAITSEYSSYRKSYSGTYEYWGWMSGTSMATPIAAGVVALYLQADPTLDVDGVKDVIANSAITDSYTSSHSAMFGHGKINALGGIEYILSQSSDPTITVTPETVNFEGYVDGTYTQTVTVTGRNLTGNISIAKSGSNVYTVSPTTITAAQAEAGATVTITYKPTTTGTTNATLTLSSTDAESKTVAITGVASYEIIDPVATAATNVTSSSFTAHWTACANASSYTLRVMPKPSYTLLLTEGFSKFTADGTTNIGSSLNNYMDNTGWTGSTLYTAVGGIRLGSGSGRGTLTSPALDLTNSNGKVSIVYKAKTYNNDTNCNMTITCGSSSATVTIPNSTEAEYTQVLDCSAATGQTISFATTATRKRVIITSIEIYSGDISAKAAGEMLFPGITDTEYTVTGLEPETTYIYDVKAIYGTDESNWSNQIEVTTLEEETGTPLAEILTSGVNGEEYLVSDDLAVVDIADYANNAFVTDGEGNWIMVTASDNDTFEALMDISTIKGKTLKGTLSNIELNPVLTVTEAPEASDNTVSYEVVKYYLSEDFHPMVNEVIDVVGWWNAGDGALRAYSPDGGVQGQSLTLDTSWGASSNTLQNGKRYEVRCAINIKEAWNTPAGIRPMDYEYYFQNYLGYALRLPDNPTAIGTIGLDGYNEVVNVYNAQGQLIRKNVKAGEATRNLPRGIYIVGNKKVVVK